MTRNLTVLTGQRADLLSLMSGAKKSGSRALERYAQKQLNRVNRQLRGLRKHGGADKPLYNGWQEFLPATRKGRSVWVET